METIIKSAVIADESVMVWAVPAEISLAQTSQKNHTHVGLVASKSELPQQSKGPAKKSELVLDTSRQDEGLLTPEVTNSDLDGDAILEMHQENLLKLEQQAIKDGYAEGYLKGEADAKREYLETIALLQQLADSGKSTISAALQDADDLVGAIIFEAVCKIVGERLVTVEGCQEVVSQTIKNTIRDEIVSLKVSPKDFDRLSNLKTGQANSLITEALKGLPLEADVSVELGGCFIKLKDGAIDGRIETQFRLFAQSIKEATHRD